MVIPPLVRVLVVGDGRREDQTRALLAALDLPLQSQARFQRKVGPIEAIVAEARGAAPSRGVVVIVEREDEIDAQLAQGADEVVVEPLTVATLSRAVRHATLRAAVRDDHAIEARTLERLLSGLACAAEPALASLALDLDGLRTGSMETLDDFDAALDDCARATEQIGALLRDVTMLAPLDDRDGRSPVAVEELLGQVLHVLGGGAALHAHVEVSADPELPVVLAPRRRLARTLASLVVQALDATPVEPPPALRRLRVSLRGLPDAVGISFDVRPTLDTPPTPTRFALADEGRLAVARAALRAIDGELFTERGPDGSVRIVVFLPRPHSLLPPAIDVLPIAQAARKRTRVLVVDRDPRVLRALSRALSDRYDVLVAIGVEEALALAREVPVDVLVIDPRRDDPPATSAIDELVRIQPNLLDRVILMGQPPEGGMTQGAPVLKKPLRRAQLLIAIESRLASPRSNVLN